MQPRNGPGGVAKAAHAGMYALNEQGIAALVLTLGGRMVSGACSCSTGDCTPSSVTAESRSRSTREHHGRASVVTPL